MATTHATGRIVPGLRALVPINRATQTALAEARKTAAAQAAAQAARAQGEDSDVVIEHGRERAASVEHILAEWQEKVRFTTSSHRTNPVANRG